MIDIDKCFRVDLERAVDMTIDLDIGIYVSFLGFPLQLFIGALAMMPARYTCTPPAIPQGDSKNVDSLILN